jgi:WD40 repeat protein
MGFALARHPISDYPISRRPDLPHVRYRYMEVVMPQPFGYLVPLVALLFLAPAGRAETPKPRLDAAGDPLPDGALMRVGTRRLHHIGSATNVVFAPDGRSLASIGRDGLARLWETATGKEVRRFEVPTGDLLGYVNALAISPDGKTLLGGGSDGAARLWDVATGKGRLVLRELGKRVVGAACFAPDGKTIAVFGFDCVVRIHDAATGQKLPSFPPTWPTTSRSPTMAFSPDGKALAAIGLDKALCLVDPASGAEVKTLLGDSPGIICFAFSPDGKALATGWNDGLVRVWDVATGCELRHLDGHEDAVTSVHFSLDGRLIATAGRDGAVFLWDAATGKELRSCHAAWVSAIALSPDGKVLASASWDGTLRLWDVATAKELPQSAGRRPVACAALSPDGKLLVTGHRGDGVRLWDASTGRPVPTPPEFDGPVTRVTFSRDGKLLAAGNLRGGFALCEAASGKKRFETKGDKQSAWWWYREPPLLALTPDNRRLAVARGVPADAVNFYDAATGKLLSASRLTAPADPGALAWHLPPLGLAPDGRTILSASGTTYPRESDSLTQGGALRLYESATGKQLRQLFEPSNKQRVTDVAFAPDGRAMAAVTSDGMAWVWETATGGQRRKWRIDTPGSPGKWPDYLAPGDWGVAPLVAFSPDGRLLATSKATGEVRVWHIGTSEELRSFKGHHSWLTSLAFAAGGPLLSAGADGTAVIWDASGPKPDADGSAEKVEAEAAWAELGATDPASAYDTVARLIESPEAAVGLLRRRLKPAAAAGPKHTDRLIGQLNDDDFIVREKASEELANLGPLAEKALRRAAQAAPSAEVAQRVADLLQKIESGARPGEALRQTRAMEALETIATLEAQKLLEELAKGAPDAAQTQEAEASLMRLASRSPAQSAPPPHHRDGKK